MSLDRKPRRRSAGAQWDKHEDAVYREGAAAFYAGVSPEECPYTGMDKELWCEGWMTAYQASPRTKTAAE